MHDWRRDLGEAVAGSSAELRFAEPLSKHTTFRIGGLADAWVRVDDRPTLARLLRVCRDAEVRTWLLGRGSNVLISDQGLRGVVICLGGELARIAVGGSAGSGVQVSDQDPRTPEPQNPVLVCGGGAGLDAVATFAEEQRLLGAEFLAGIPGTVGGGMHSNAGAFGRSLGDIVTSATVLDREGRESVLAGEQLRREYRRPMVGDGLVVAAATLRLAAKGAAPDVRFPTPTEIRQQRREKHPAEPSAGSFFRNPEKDGERIPAGRLIEQCGLKGRTIGGARVSEQHANFIINAGKARFADVYELVQVIKATVEEQTGIELEEEVQYLPGPGEGRGRGSGAVRFEGSGPAPEPRGAGTRDPMVVRR